jgi:hypothetical protein
MVRLIFETKSLQLEVLGLHKFWAFKGSFNIPYNSIRDARVDPAAARRGWKGWRLPGTHIQGVITAGTFYKKGQRIFWDVGRSRNALVIELENHKYDEVIVEVENPVEDLRRIQELLEKQAR